MKKIILSLLVFSFCTNILLAQDEPDNRPVRDIFNSTMLVDNQTPYTMPGGTLEMIIHHRFGKIEKITDLFGLYAPSNIRLGMNYGITDDITIGFGTEKNNKMQELHWKWNILNQTRSGSMPLTITYFGNAVIDTRDDASFGESYAFTNRFSYFNQLIASRKFNDKLSLQVAGGYAHINAVDSLHHNDAASVSVGGKYSITETMSILVEYDQPLMIKTIRNFQEKPDPNLALGLEINTATHTFSVFAANYEQIIAQKNILFNAKSPLDGDFVLGFNITVRF